MHDLKWIRDNPTEFDAGLRKRGSDVPASRVLELDAERRRLQTAVQELLGRRNEASKAIGAAKSKGGDASALMAEVAALKTRIPEAEVAEREAGEALEQLLAALPNIPAPDVPEGRDETANVEINRHGMPRAFDFKPKEHDALGENLGLMDFAAAARISGARFVVLQGALARLDRALANFMLDVHTREFGYVETIPPLLVRDEAAFGTGNLPKFADDLFRTTNGYWLIPTAEMPLTNIVREQIVEEAKLPMRLTALTPCFRSEAGAAGKDTRGMIRQHQFSKVELVSITTPEQSEAEHERMTRCAETILERLDIPYRRMLLCTGDMSFASRKTYDIEVWLPGQGRYREISSCSNCGDFQARRMRARYRPAAEKQSRFVHTLNGSGIAIGRALIAVLETYQQADGTVAIPDALRPYMGGLNVIGPAAG
ncbi:MAG TPA: serine--tRNA ligase [Candidatus Cybelea sp.]|nr:serine--tRNA ligase [Candidatus Cybelea sp.]